MEVHSHAKQDMIGLGQWMKRMSALLSAALRRSIRRVDTARAVL